MPSELKRGAVRIISNYTRLFAMMLIGIAFVPIFIYGIGVDAFGIVGLVGAGVGIAEMCRAIVGQSMIRELGAAYHDADSNAFPKAYNSAIVLSAAAASLVVALYGGLFLLLPVLNIPPHLMAATAWMLLAKGLLSVLGVLTSPQFNMYRVTERMVLFNLWKTLNRATDLLVAIVLFLILGIRDPSRGLILFGFLSAGTSAAVQLFAVALMFRLESRMFPSFALVNRESIRSLLSTAGWNTVVVTALSLHLRLDQIIMNIAFGPVGNAIFTLGVRLTGYIWQFAGAATDGLDAVSARISSTNKDQRGIAEMIYHTTRLQAVVTIPVSLIVIVMAQPLMTLWVGRVTDDPTVIPKAVVVAQILTIGMVAKGIAHVWMRILYGAGHVRTYAPLVLCGGAMNPVIAVLLILFLPPEINYLGPAIAFTIAFIVFHFLLLPVLVARCMNISVIEVWRPLIKPAIATAISSPALFIAHLIGASDSPLALVAAVAIFGAVWMPLGWWYVLSADDRARLSRGIGRRLAWKTKRPLAADLPADPESSHMWDGNVDPEVGDEFLDITAARKPE